MEALELKFASHLESLESSLLELKAGTQVCKQTAVCLCDKAVLVKLDELSAESKAAFILFGDLL